MFLTAHHKLIRPCSPGACPVTAPEAVTATLLPSRMTSATIAHEHFDPTQALDMTVTLIQTLPNPDIAGDFGCAGQACGNVTRA